MTFLHTISDKVESPIRSKRRNQMPILNAHQASPGLSARYLSLTSCPGGYFKPANTNVCEPVRQGYYSPANDLLRYPCEPGTFSNTVVAETCMECYPGTYSNLLRNKECFTCEPGSFAFEFGNSFCETCDTFYYNGYGSDYGIVLSPGSNGAPYSGVFCLEPVNARPAPAPSINGPTAAPTESWAPTTTAPTFPFTRSVSTSPTEPTIAPSFSPSTNPSKAPSVASALEPTTLEPELSISPSLRPSMADSFNQKQDPLDSNNTKTDDSASSSSSVSTQAILWPILILAAILGFVWAIFYKKKKHAKKPASSSGEKRRFRSGATVASGGSTSFGWNRRKMPPPPPPVRARQESFGSDDFPHDPNWPTDDCFSVSDTQQSFNLHNAFTQDDHDLISHTADENSVLQPSVTGTTSVWSLPAATDVTIGATPSPSNILMDGDEKEIEEEDEEESGSV